MKFKQEDNDELELFQRLVSEDGKIEMGIHPVIFGYRVRAGYVGNMVYELDWCGGDEQQHLELLYSIMKNILENKGNFDGIPINSTIKPYYKDAEFVHTVNSMVVKPLEIVLLKPLELDRRRLMNSL